MYAAEAGNNEVVELLIRNGAEVDAKNDGGETALMLASKSGHTETAEILIRNGADVNARDNLGYPVVAFAMEFGHMETAEMLIRNGVDIHPEELQTAMFLYTLSRRRAEMLRSQKPNEEELI
jgi:ankyrin repeat protein